MRNLFCDLTFPLFTSQHIIWYKRTRQHWNRLINLPPNFDRKGEGMLLKHGCVITRIHLAYSNWTEQHGRTLLNV